MPPKKQSAPQGAQSQRDKTLHRIIEDASRLHREKGVVTAREVKALREAFDNSVPPNIRTTHQLAIQCDNLLHTLEKRASAPNGAAAAAASSSSPTSPKKGFLGSNAAAAASTDSIQDQVSATTNPLDSSAMLGGSSTSSGTMKSSTPASPASPVAASPATAAAGKPPAKEKSAAARISGSWGEDNTVNWKFTDIPLERRMQTLVITVFCFFTGLPLVLAFSGLLLYLETTRWFMVAYIVSIFVFPVKHPTSVWRWWIDSSFFKYARDYFPVRLVIPKAVRKLFNPRKNYLVCYHPHGVHSFGAVLSLGSNCNGIYDLMPGFTFHVQTLPIQFYVPFWREMLRFAGMGDASAKTIETTLTSGPGQCAVLVVGGAEESLLASPNTNDLLLSKRKGFVKLALRSGAHLVPVFGFGETNIYGNHATGRPELQRWLLRMQKVLGFAFPLIKGRGWFNYNWGPLPHRKLIVTVFGAPVELPHLPNPTQEEIDHYHKIYVQALMDLYKEHKAVYDLHAQSDAQVVK